MGILYSLLSPAFFAIGNYVDKFLLEKHDFSVTVITIWGGIVALLVGVMTLILTGLYPLDAKSLVIILSSGFLTSVYLLPYYKALTLDETSYVVPLFNFYPIFVLLFSFVLLHEKLSGLQYLGSAVILLGGFFLSIKSFSLGIFKLRGSFFYMILSCILFAVAQVLYKFGVQTVPFWHTLPYEGFGIALGGLCIALYKQNYKRFIKETRSFKKTAFVAIGINEVSYLLARYTGYFAISLISVSLVSIMSGLQPFFVLLFGIVLSVWFPHILKEVINKKALIRKSVSIVCMFIGLILILAQ